MIGISKVVSDTILINNLQEFKLLSLSMVFHKQNILLSFFELINTRKGVLYELTIKNNTLNGSS